MTPFSSGSPLGADRAMTPEAVATEITGGTKDRFWVLRRVPRSCRVPHNTRPPLFWEKPTRRWWETGRKSA